MTKNLIIVESPAKARTLGKYLGKEFKALASYGHVRDLLPKSGAVEPANDFEMHYTLVDRNKKHVDEIAREARKADALYLATDPDREGEAISWHLYELLRERGVLNGKPVHRVVFHEITKTAIEEALTADSDPSARKGARSITWSVSTCRRCYGRRCAGDYPQVGCKVLPCGSSASARTKSSASSNANTGPSNPISALRASGSSPS